MKTKCRLFVSCAAALALTTSFAMADSNHHSKSGTTNVRTAKTSSVSGNSTAGTTTTYRSRNYSGTRAYSGARTYSGTRNYSGARYYSGGGYYGGSGTSVYIGGFGYPYYGYGYGYPYSYGYYPYGSGYGYGYDYSPGYTYGYYRSSYGYNGGSVVFEVQRRLARAGYYRGPIDGVMGPGTRWAIRAYERNHGLRVDGVISGPLMRNMGLRY